MPPFRTGLLKRKIETKNPQPPTAKQESDENETEDLDEDLIRGEFDDDNDASDSEYEGDSDAAVSGQEIVKGVFDDADSTLGDEEDEEASNQSSELTDSEPDDSEEEDGESQESNEESEQDSEDNNSTDSGAESGPSTTLSSDDTDKKKTLVIHKNTKQKKKLLKDKQSYSQTEKKNSVDLLADKIKESSVAMQPVGQKDEYESGDTSDEEDRRNTVGDVPSWWYSEYGHVGYDLDGRRIMRPPQRDHIDEFLKRCEDPEFWRTVRDPQTGQDVRLAKEDLELLARLRASRPPSDAHDDYQPWVEWFSREVLATPLRAFPEHKRSFLPSRSEQRQVARLVHALKMGWAKTRKQIADERRQKKERKFYNLWGSGSEEPPRGVHKHVPAPRRPPPGHHESYNPPPEYLLDKQEMKEWNKLSATPWKRKYTFLPQQYKSLRHVPAYERFVRERFLRCLDLYLAPRAIRMRLTISAKDLVPQLPSPRELQPFPTQEALRFVGHAAAVRCLDLSPCGQYLVSGSDDRTLKVWEVQSGRCLRTIPLGARVTQAAWGPAPGLSLVAAAAGPRLLLLNPGADIGDHRVARRTDDLLRDPPPQHDVTMDPRTAAVVRWADVTPEEWALGLRLAVTHSKDIINIAWHGRGDYLSSVSREAGARALAVHQVSRRRSQLPLRRGGLLQAAAFHPRRPHLLVASQRHVRVYDLARQTLLRRLQAPAQWLSAIALHPAGDNLLAVSYDAKCLWFDLELSSRPYAAPRLHGRAVRAAAFHPRYPLFATGGDDPYIVVSHGMVYNDLLQNPLLVPLKQLAGGARTDDLVTLALRWHPTQPWLLAAAADHTLRLYA